MVLDSAMRPSLSKAPTAVASRDLLPGETLPKEESLESHSGEKPVALSGEDAVTEVILDSSMCPSVSKAPTAVASRDLPPGETSPKEESLEPRSGEDGDCRRRRVTRVLGSARNAVRDSWKRAMADRAKKARARREALLLGIAHDAACDAWQKVTADRIENAHAQRVALLLSAQDAACDAWKKVFTDQRISTLTANSMARRLQRFWRLRAASFDKRNRRVAQLCVQAIANLNWKYYGTGYYKGL